MTYLQGHDDFVSRYMRFCDINNSEAPAVYHRWVCFSILGAALGRSVWIEQGPYKIYLNQYMMLMGSPGARKGSAMSIGRKLLKASGFRRFAADKTSKERFLMDMKHTDADPTNSLDDIELLSMDTAAESYIMSGEFTDFIGQGNMEFVTMLTNLWDNLDEYKQPKIQGKSVHVHKPTVNLLGANTPEGFSLAFPPEALGNGFLSRVLMLYAEPTSNRVAWPSPPDELLMADLVGRIEEIRNYYSDQALSISKEARDLGTYIYKHEIPVDDPRFTHYQQRRFTHLLKIAGILACTDLSDSIEEIHLLRANTALSRAERHMPKALGEFGASKYSAVMNKILTYLAGCSLPQTATQLLRVVSRDINKQSELTDILMTLKNSGKIQSGQVRGVSGYLPFHAEKKEWPDHTLDLDWLTEQEIF